VAAVGLVCASIAGGQALAGEAAGLKPVAAAAATAEASGRLTIQVLPGDWGDVDPSDIEHLLYAVARELWLYFPDRKLQPITVAPTDRHPFVRYAKGSSGEYLIYLSAKGRHWSQYAYQFAHEFAHVLSNYDRNSHRLVQRNQWFDESLCETAALFALRRLSASWQNGVVVPFAHWKSYSTALQAYVGELLAQPHRVLPAKASFVDWYRGNAASLDRSPYLREREEVVAGMLLPLFEQHPEAWATIGYLNLEESDATGSFEQYLANWRRNTPPHQRPLVERIIELFGFAPQGS
jgi:hypothetical protein